MSKIDIKVSHNYLKQEDVGNIGSK